MSARTIVITGASDGIGASAAGTLTAAGDEVVVVGRSPDKTKAVADRLGARYYLADYSRLDDVRRLAETLRENHPRIDVLANNAGGIMGERQLTSDGFEKTFQVNHLAPFLLTHLLMDVLEASRATVVNTASIAAKLFSHLDLDDLGLEHGYTAEKAYGNGKLANILMARELDRRYRERGISAASFHPGLVQTGFASETSSLLRLVYHTPLRRLVTVSPEKGADTLVWLATTTPGRDWPQGEYFAKRKVSTSSPQASDAGLARDFWDVSERLLDLDPTTR